MRDRMNTGPVRRRLQVVIAALLCIPATAALEQAPPAATHTVVIRQMRFEPQQIDAHPGDTIEWKNEDMFAHTATANDGSFDSQLIQPGQSWKTVVTASGEIGYHCRPHPNMAAMLRVTSAESAAANAGSGGSIAFNPPRKPHEFHPILVNFTTALLPLALLSDLLGLWLKRRSLHDAARWMVVYCAIVTPLTAAAGWWWKSASAGALLARTIEVHEWLGTSLAVVFIALAAWRWRTREGAPGYAYLASAAVAVLALVYQGSLGGAMAFGR